MKNNSIIRRMVTISVLCMLFALPAAAQSRMFGNLPENDNITTVYIGKALLKLAGNVAKLDGVPRDAIRNLTGVEVVTCSSKSAFSKILQPRLKKAISENRFETLVTADEGKENCTLYGRENADGTLSRLLIVQKEGSECNIVVVTGKIDLAALLDEYGK